MAYPPPTEKQAKILWASVTALAIGVLAGLMGILALGMAKLASMLSSVLLPLAIAGVIAYSASYTHLTLPTICSV